MLYFTNRNVLETHRASTAEPGEGPSLVNTTRVAPACGLARGATAGDLMWAPHGRAQRNDIKVHLDSAGDSFGAPVRRILRVGEK